ncbi:MAG: hypothetical protein WD602_01155 [Actinomycetota bacterium]
MKQDRFWNCPTCGRLYKEGQGCPQEDEHWEDFTSALNTVREAPAVRPAA